MHRALLPTLASSCLALAGCDGKIHFGPKYDLIGPLIGAVTDVLMKEVPSDAPIPLRADAATVVFVRPSSEADALLPIVLDEQGRFLGQSLPSSYFAATVPPGEHVLIVCNDGAAALRARLDPGKRYFVELAHEGAFSRRIIPRAIRPGSELWARLTRLYTEKKHLVEDGTSGEAYVRARTELRQRCLRAANDEIAAANPAELQQRSLAPGDGQ